MALIPATLAQLQEVLTNTITAATQDRPTTAAIFQLMYNTGLRVREVLEVERWTVAGPEDFTVQLEKKEGTRGIGYFDVPAPLRARYYNQVPYELETYSSVNNTFKYYGRGLIFGNDTRRTTCHAFRYQYMKQLSADGLTVAQVAEVMGHMNLANTSKYIQDEIWLGS